MYRSLCFLLIFAMAGCAQHAAPFVPTNSQAATSNAGTNAMQPADSVTAHLLLRNHTNKQVKFFIEWSYHADPFWHTEQEVCVYPGREYPTKIVYNHLKWGPQIQFKAAVNIGICSPDILTLRKVFFRGMNFDPDAHFQVTYFKPPYGRPHDWTLCAHGAGNKETCDR